jgi:hypothetical protein
MAFNNDKDRRENALHTGMGVGPHDYVTYTYGTGGGTSATNLTDIKYYLGGQQASGELVGHIVYTYDANDNIITAERHK